MKTPIEPRSARQRPPVCFVGFFGLNRSLRWTAPSIEQNILDPLRDHGFTLRIAAHFNLPAEIDSLRSGESRVRADRWPRELPFEICWAEPQTDATFAKYPELVSAPHFAGDSATEQQTNRNLALQLHSLWRLWDLCRHIGADDADLFVLLRPDLQYIDRIDAADIHSRVRDQGIDLITPDWHQWGGLNDRFAFCSARGAASYCQRVRRAHEHLAHNCRLHAESFLKSVAEEDGLRVGLSSIRAMRVRANGKTWREDFDLSPIENARAATRVYREQLGRFLKI